MEFKFENKEIEELTRKMEEAKKEYLLTIHNLAFAISRDSNDLILIRKSETKKQKRGCWNSPVSILLSFSAGGRTL